MNSQLPIDAWHDIIGESTFAATNLDQLVRIAHRSTLGGLSMRESVTRANPDDGSASEPGAAS